MNITKFNIALKAIISTFDILKVASSKKIRDLFESRYCWTLLTFFKVFSPKQGKLNEISHFFLRYLCTWKGVGWTLEVLYCQQRAELVGWKGKGWRRERWASVEVNRWALAALAGWHWSGGAKCDKSGQLKEMKNCRKKKQTLI